MFNTLWAVGCQTFRVEKEQKCFTGSAVINQRRGPRARAGKFCAPKCSLVFAEENQMQASRALVPTERGEPALQLSLPTPHCFQPWFGMEQDHCGWSPHAPTNSSCETLGKVLLFSKKKKPQGLLMIPSLQASHPKCSQGLLKVHQHIWIRQ